ncbi:cytochrome c3 family protein [Oryzomonas rubra]|uniref:Cytochrome C n=1 Tax=Oryzomonas rubra TaxID=2509454 RepID=A0A5A9X9M6_9BACT|nr:cytochrome c3 family protein [Oryzomonas rubra]KAA0889125.1 cytochrome C [Oryzomonas rubra]
MNLLGSLLVLLLPLAVLWPLASFAAEPQEIVCIQCHGAMPGKIGEPVKLWKGSIHAENGIACNACHGGDPKDAANAMSPARGFLGAPKEPAIPAFCGRCHVGVLKDFLASAHGKALGKGGPTCVTCHSNHLVVKASLEIINEKRCSQCHSYERAKVIRAAMQETEAMIVAIDKRIAAYKVQGVDTESLEKGLFAVRNRFHTLFHNVDVGMVKKESAGIQADLKKIQDQLTALDESRQKRKIAGAVVVSAMLLLALFAHLLRKTFD